MNKKNTLYVMRPNYKGLEELVEYINKYSNTNKMDMIEIGSYVGESTQFFLKNFKRVLSIDPFLNNYDLNDPACNHLDFDKVYNIFKENIKQYSNINHIRKKSDDAIKDIIGNKYDMVYIDGLHTYDQVNKDIINYKQIIKENGFISGHDYHPNWNGVRKAVDELLGKPDMVFSDFSWIKRI